MPLDLSRIQALCFDVDGTLSDTDDVVVHHLTALLSRFSFVFPHTDWCRLSRRIVMAMESPVQYLYGVPDRLNIDGLFYQVIGLVGRLGKHKKSFSFRIVPGAKDALMVLQNRYRMSIVSARDEHTTHSFLEQHGLEEWFDCIATAMTCAHTKPYPDPIFWVANQMGIHPEQCLMIGDTSVDMRAAKSAGAQALGVLSGFGQEEELLQSGADMIVGSVADLPACLC